MKTFSEARGDTAVFTFGRFNPPTTGHEKLINALAREAGSGQPMYVYPSHSQNAKKDPLPHAKKVAYMKKMFPRYKKNIKVSKSRNVFDIAVELYKKGHKAIVMVVGSDRVQEFANLLDTYNGVDGRHGFYGFDDIRVVSAGERDPDAEGVEGMSASKMRAAAQADNYDEFKLGLPKGFKDGQKLFKDVRTNMGLKEEYNLTLEELNRDLYIRGEIWNVGDVVKTNDGDEGTIIRKGTNYVVFEDLRRVWLHNLEEVKQDKDIKDREGTQPAKYYAKDAEGDDMSVSTKKKRAAHFAKSKSGPAPGDAGAKTKPSKHTKKFKQMYGESDALKKANERQKKELDQLKIKHDREDDRARAQDTSRKNRQPTTDESLWANIHKKRQRIKQGSGEKMRKKGEKGAPTPAQMQRAKNASEETIQSWFESTETRASYQLKYNDDWWWKLNETHDLMLEKIGASCCDDCKEDKQSMTPWALFKEQNFYGEIEEAAEYQGRKVTLNKPMKGDVKKSKVYVKNDKGNVVKVEFGDPNMEIKRDDPARRKSFRARHNCDNPGPKYKARYWSCKFWEKGRTVTSLKKG